MANNWTQILEGIMSTGKGAMGVAKEHPVLTAGSLGAGGSYLAKDSYTKAVIEEMRAQGYDDEEILNYLIQ